METEPGALLAARHQPSVSILIVNWRTRNDLERCLASLSPLCAAIEDDTKGAASGSPDSAGWSPTACHPPMSVEVIVVDNASGDDSVEMARSRFPWAMMIASDVNLGYAEGNNLAAARANGPLLFFLNADTVVPPGALETLAGFLQSHPHAGLVAPRLVSPDGSTQRSVRGMPTPTALFGAWLGLERWFPYHPVWAGYRLPRFDYGLEQRAPQPMASAWMGRREAWEQVGPFDPSFPLFFNDVDWCLRAEEGGWEVWYTPAAAITHTGGASTRQIKPRATWESHRALAHFYRKHYAKRLGPFRLAVCQTAILLTGAARAAWYGMRRAMSDGR